MIACRWYRLDRLMLADAGVSLLADRQAMARFGEVGHVEALEVDARVRGLDSNPPARLVSDEEWVQRVVSADRVMSWT